MKLQTIIALSLFCVLQAWAQAYQPFVVEGKRWNCHPGFYDMDSEKLSWYNSYFTIHGDTLLDDVPWKNLYYYSSYRDSLVYIGSMRELDRKVFYYEGIEFPVFTNVRKPVLLYDFGLQIGESMPSDTGDKELDLLSIGRLHEKKTEEMGDGISVNVYVFDSSAGDSSAGSIPISVWFEGIGTNHLFWPVSYLALPTSKKMSRQSPSGWSLRDELEVSKHTYISCELDGVILANYLELDALTQEEIDINSVGLPAANANQSAPAFDLQGRRLTEAPQKGVYIRGGKKIVQ